MDPVHLPSRVGGGRFPPATSTSATRRSALSSDYRPSVANTTLKLDDYRTLVESVDWGVVSLPGVSEQCDRPLQLRAQGHRWPWQLPRRGDHRGPIPAPTEPPAGRGDERDRHRKRRRDDRADDFQQWHAIKDPVPLDAYNAAAQAKVAGTTVYTIEYNSNGSCGADSPTPDTSTDNADTLMQDMANKLGDRTSAATRAPATSPKPSSRSAPTSPTCG